MHVCACVCVCVCVCTFAFISHLMCSITLSGEYCPAKYLRISTQLVEVCVCVCVCVCVYSMCCAM